MLAAGGVLSQRFRPAGPRATPPTSSSTGSSTADPSAIDFGALHRLLFEAVGLYAASGIFNYLAAYTLAGVVQRTMHRLRADVEDKLNRLPLSYIDHTARGDLLSRVTNDIDNLAQSLQQTLSQMLDEHLHAGRHGRR